MDFTDEKDYIMRIIKEMVRVLFSLVFGKSMFLLKLKKKTNMKYLVKNCKAFLT